MLDIKSSNFITSVLQNKNTKDIEYLSSNSIKITYQDGTFQTYVLDDYERIIYCNLNGEIIQKNEYDENGNLIKKLECTEYGFDETIYEDNRIISPISKQRNGEITIPYNANYSV